LETATPARAGQTERWFPVFPDVRNVVDISVGELHTCAVTGEGQVICWGDGSHIHLSASPPASLPPTQVEGIDTAVEVAAGQDSTLVLLQNGDVLAWGWSPSENAWVTTPTVVAQGAQRIFNGGAGGLPDQRGRSTPGVLG
jgi:alpha-tubulin suppressor-like RCC1 family protein